MVRGKYVVLLDDLAASSTATFESRFQTAFDVIVDADGATVDGIVNDLHIRSAGFDSVTFGNGAAASGLNYASVSASGNQSTFLTVLYPTPTGGDAPVVTADGGTVTVTQGGETDTLVFSNTSGNWELISVNGASALGISDGSERSIVPLREGRDDASEVPSWLLETIR